MTYLIEEDKPLPQFRKDLELFPGPEETDGSPTYNLYDPVRAKYFKMNWAESLIIQNLKPNMTLKELHELIQEQTTLDVTIDEIKYFFLDAFRYDLLATMKPSEHHEKIHDSKRWHLFKWLLYNYLYIKIPIINPDAFLTRTVKYVRFLGSSWAFILYLCVGLTGFFLLFTRIGEFLHTFTYFFNIKGFLIYALAISCVKIIHEFSHAYTAKNYGVYVPSMGVAFIVLWPVLYTDVTDGWKLKSRYQRFAISIAGIVAELVIAGICTIGWVLSEPGVFQSIFFVLTSITLISTLIINLNPAVRFDGYYILGDLWGIDNLQFRAFGVARWKIRQWLLGIEAPCPEPRMTHTRLVGMIVYSIYTWIYRVFLYTAIAVLVYYKFTKALGLFLFFVEIAIFLVWPIASEIRALTGLRGYIKTNPRMMITLTVLGLIFAYFAVPLPHKEYFDAIAVAADSQTVYIPSPGYIKDIRVKREDVVSEGDVLLVMDSPPLNGKIALHQLEKKILERDIFILGQDDQNRAFIPEKRAKLDSNNERLQALLGIRDELDIKAQISGQLYLWNTNLKEGQYLPKNEVIGRIADMESHEVIAFVPEQYVNTVYEGQQAYFRVPSTNDIFKGKIVNVNPLRSPILAYPQLASINQGEIPVVQEPSSGALMIVDSYYTVRVLINKTDAQLRFGQTGTLEVDGPWRSKLMVLVRKVISVFWRESGV